MSKELILAVTADDCEWMYFCAGGKGGQHQNKTASACRCRHKDSGAEGLSRDERSQHQNKRIAFRRMAETQKFKNWLRIETSRRMLSKEQKAAQLRLEEAKKEAIERYVEAAMAPENLKIETYQNGEWIEG